MTEMAPESRAGAPTLRREADHLVRLPGGPWSLWRTAALRSAGFPASLVLALSSDRAAAAADRWLDRQADIARCRDLALRELADRPDAADPTARPALRALRSRVKRGIARRDGPPGEAALAAAMERGADARAAFVAACDADMRSLEQQLEAILSDPRFQEAAIWQNRRGFHVARRRLCQREGPPSERRHAAEFVAMLVQRYAVKNDSVGFFGPVGWATLTDAPVGIDCRPGPALLERREVYFEGWTIDALAGALNEDGALRPWIAPRLNSGVWLDGAGAYVPGAGAVPVTPEEHRLLRLCDGETTAREIAARVAREGAAGSEAEVFAALDRLVRADLACWRLEVAPQLYPERELESRLERIGDAALHDTCVSALRRLAGARDRVAAAAGRPAELDAAIERLEADFGRLTGQEPARRPGQMYAARGLVYEDCRRACDVTIGAGVLERLGPPLSIVLNSARWVSAQWKTAFTRHLRRCHEELRRDQGTAAIDAHAFVMHALARAAEPQEGVARRGRLLPAVLDELRREHQQRWRAVLPVDDDARRVRCDVAGIAPRAAEAFDSGECGSWAGYFSPDVLVAWNGTDGMRGGCHFVLGEVHSANTLLWSALSAQHPDPAGLQTALARDADGQPVVLFQYSKAACTARLNLTVAPSFWRYEAGDDPPARPPCRSLPAGRLVAVDDGSRILLRARDGGLEFDAYEPLAQFLHHEISGLVVDWLPSTPHSPRVTIGDLTVARERWHFAAGELPFAGERDAGARFLKMRAWARTHGLPRRVFCRFPDEPKPCYLDFNSLVYADVFAKMLRRMGGDGRVRITEMFPGLDDAWLVDGDGRRYTSELRIIARVAGAAGPPVRGVTGGRTGAAPPGAGPTKQE